MKNIIFLFTIILIGCNSKTETKVENEEKQNNKNVIKGSKIGGGKYFEYDEIEYYKSVIEEEQVGELHNNQKKSTKDSLKFGVFLGEIPKSITDTIFINNLEAFGYTKSKIAEKKFDEIDEVFTEKEHSETYDTACIYIYRDILIFKKNDKTIGIAKICFDCDANVIVGTKSNTESFGMSGDYEKLRKIIRGK